MKGFTIHPLAPAARARWMSSGEPSVVSMRMGSAACWGSFFTVSTNCTPFMRGMFTSHTTPLKPPVTFCTASTPSTASVTAKPACSSAMRTC